MSAGSPEFGNVPSRESRTSGRRTRRELEDEICRLEAEQGLLARELNHRVKNLFAVVTSIIGLSGKAKDGEDAIRNAYDRVMALARANEVSLSQTRAVRAPLRRLVQSVVQPYQSLENNRIRIEGPDVLIPAAQVTAMGLLMHELATNAIKHGALRDGSGTVTIRWEVEPRSARDASGRESGHNHLVLDWTEDGDRSLARAAGNAGFGLRLMRQAALQLEAELEQTWTDNGLLMRLDMPL